MRGKSAVASGDVTDRRTVAVDLTNFLSSTHNTYISAVAAAV